MTNYAFDLDGTLCNTPNGNEYENSTPIQGRIDKVNALFEQGHIITIYTARGCRSGLTDKTRMLTEEQLKRWGVKHHRLSMGEKIFFDLLIDDKAINVKDWDKQVVKKHKLAIVAGAFDIMHPGYIELLRDAKSQCETLLVLLHEDPGTERVGKNNPAQNLHERYLVLKAIKYVDKIKTYQTEKDLLVLLAENTPHIRILGTDYKNKAYTGKSIPGNSVHFHNRDHGWSCSKLRNKIYLLEKDKNEEKNGRGQ